MVSKSEECDFIPSVLYDQIAKCMSIVSVEAVIVKENGLLFLRRKNEPAMGEWWFPGGRRRLRLFDFPEKIMCPQPARMVLAS